MKKEKAVKILEFLRHSSGCHFLIKKGEGWSIISDRREIIFPDNGHVIARVGTGPSECPCLGCPEDAEEIDQDDFAETLGKVNYILEVIEDIKESGCYEEVTPSADIMSSAEMAEEQKEWGEDDPEKDTDFSICKYWVVTDDGQEPIGFNTPEEVAVMANLFKNF